MIIHYTMGKRHTYEYVKQYFQDNQCELLESIYTNMNTKNKHKTKNIL